MRRPQRRYQLPPLVSHPLDDLWSVVVPIARTNLVTNPSFETNTTNWQDIVGTMARTTTYQYHGAYSLQMTPDPTATDGLRYGIDTPLALTNGTTYSYSCKFRGQAGLKYTMNLESSTFANRASVAFTATGRWQWVWGFYTEGATAALYWSLRKAAGLTNTAVFYVDGVQVEACAAGEVFPTTYIDGDQQGLVPNQYPPAYIWNGTPHASTSSRSGLTRAGGRVVKFKTFGWLLTAIIGLGSATPQHRITEYATLDGGNDEGTRKPTRQFTLVGQFAGRTYGRLRENRGDLAVLLDRDLIGADQRLKLRYQAMRGCDLVGEEAEIVCKYAGGLEGNTDGHFGGAAPITFTNYLPVVLSPGDAGVVLDVQDSVVNANYIARRSPLGAWSALGTGGDGTGGAPVVRDIIVTAGRVYVAGSNTGYGGVANTLGLAYYDITAGTWNALSTGITGGLAYALALMPNGTIIVGGTFTAAGGVANTVRIAQYNPTTNTFAALGTGAASDIVAALRVLANGDLVAGGGFSGMGGVANTAGIARWNGSVWNAMGTGAAGGAVLNITSFGDYIVAGGSFTGMGGVANTAGIARWSINSAAWSSIGNAASTATVNAVAYGPNGVLYAAGLFTAIGGVSASRIASYNGTSWSPLSTGLNNTAGSLAFALDSTLWIGGVFTTAGGITTPDGIVRWNGSTFVYPDIDIPAGGTLGFEAIFITPDGSVYVGYSIDGTAIVAGVTTVTNGGTGHAYPALIIKGPSSGTSRIYQIVNYTTGRAIYLNLTINAGETVAMRFDPDNLSFVSDFVGNVASTILPGSNEADFFLQPGDNIISFFAASSTVTATLQWRPAYLSLDDH